MIKILTNGWGEELIKPLEKYITDIKIIGLKKDLKKNYNDYNSFLRINQELKNDSYNIVHLNSWVDIFLFKKNKDKNIKYIFESHGFHPGISFKYSLNISESIMNKIIITLFYPLFKLIYLLNIKKVDLYLVSIPGLIDYTKKYGGFWLPNLIDTNIFYKKEKKLSLDNNYTNIFYPTGLREIKNPIFAFELMEKLSKKYKNIKFYLIRQSVSNYKKYKKYLDYLSDKIIWLNQVKREELAFYYSADWDLVLGNFYPNREYAILNMIELESISCKAPIISHDQHEIIKVDLVDIYNYSLKLIEDKDFRNEYIEKNYNYVRQVHGLENVSKLYLEKIEGV